MDLNRKIVLNSSSSLVSSLPFHDLKMYVRSRSQSSRKNCSICGFSYRDVISKLPWPKYISRRIRGMSDSTIQCVYVRRNEYGDRSGLSLFSWVRNALLARSGLERSRSMSGTIRVLGFPFFFFAPLMTTLSDSTCHSPVTSIQCIPVNNIVRAMSA